VFEEGVLVQREDRVEPAQKRSDLPLAILGKLELALMQGLVHLVEHSKERASELAAIAGCPSSHSNTSEANHPPQFLENPAPSSSKFTSLLSQLFEQFRAIENVREHLGELASIGLDMNALDLLVGLIVILRISEKTVNAFDWHAVLLHLHGIGAPGAFDSVDLLIEQM
jgi:hypothetical protein